ALELRLFQLAEAVRQIPLQRGGVDSRHHVSLLHQASFRSHPCDVLAARNVGRHVDLGCPYRPKIAFGRGPAREAPPLDPAPPAPGPAGRDPPGGDPASPKEKARDRCRQRDPDAGKQEGAAPGGHEDPSLPAPRDFPSEGRRIRWPARSPARTSASVWLRRPSFTPTSVSPIAPGTTTLGPSGPGTTRSRGMTRAALTRAPSTSARNRIPGRNQEGRSPSSRTTAVRIFWGEDDDCRRIPGDICSTVPRIAFSGSASIRRWTGWPARTRPASASAISA